MATRHRFFGPNGIEVNEAEFARLLAVGSKTPLVIRAKPSKKKRRRKRKAHNYR
jgi:hypothetical protein